MHKKVITFGAMDLLFRLVLFSQNFIANVDPALPYD